jgi:hypothetical protein
VVAVDLHSLLVAVVQAMTHAELSEAPQRIAGLVVATAEGLSKRQRIDLALANLSHLSGGILVSELDASEPNH